MWLWWCLLQSTIITVVIVTALCQGNSPHQKPILSADQAGNGDAVHQEFHKSWNKVLGVCGSACHKTHLIKYVLLLFIQDLPRGVFCCGLSSIKIVDLTSTVDGGNHASFMASITHAVNYCDQCVAQQRRHTQTPQHGGRKTIQDQARLIVTLFYGCC